MTPSGVLQQNPLSFFMLRCSFSLFPFCCEHQETKTCSCCLCTLQWKIWTLLP